MPARLSLIFAGCAAATALLLMALETGSPQPGWVKGSALRACRGDTNAIAELRKAGPAAVPGLTELLSEHEPWWHRKAPSLAMCLPRGLGLAVLKWCGPVEAPGHRFAGARVLGLLGPLAAKSVPTLAITLHDSEPYIALEAGGALGRIGRASIQTLIAALSDANPRVRHAAAYGLGQAGVVAEPAIPALLKALHDQNPSVRSSSADSLWRIQKPTHATFARIFEAPRSSRKMSRPHSHSEAESIFGIR